MPVSHRSTWFRGVSFFIVAGAALTAGAADEPKAGADPVADLLARPVLGPRRSLSEAAAHAAARVPRMPEFASVGEWEAYAARTRDEVFRRVIFRGEAAAWRDAKARVEWLDTIEGGPGYHIRKLRYEAVPGLWVPALLYQPDDLGRRGKVPVVLNVNGHEPVGKAADYKQVRCINLAKRGVLALNVEWLGMGQFRTPGYRHDQINHIDLCGTSGVAVHFLAMTRAIDLLLALDHADPARVGVTGLSGGGWQTIFLAAFEPRVTLANPVAGYSSLVTRTEAFSDMGDSEQAPVDLGAVTDYAVMTALVAPRRLLLTYNLKDDCCFAAGHALPPLIDAAAPIYRLYGKEGRLRTHINSDPGTHNYLADNRQAFYRALAPAFFADDPTFNPREVPSDAEIKTPAQLNVPLPADNATLHTLALGLSKALPRDATLPRDPGAAKAWQAQRRGLLRDVLRLGKHEARAESSKEVTQGDITATLWTLKVGDWSVPVVELTRKGAEPKGTTLLLADGGRKASASAAREALGAGRRVLAVEPFFVGEGKPFAKSDLFALLLSSVGDRPLGIQAGQVAAVARWARDERKAGPVSVVAEGPRTSVMALAAAGVEPDAIADLRLTDTAASLKTLIESETPFPAAPELFTFGLLESFDTAPLAALIAPRPVSFARPTGRVVEELGSLKAWYAILGVGHDPLH